MKQRKQGLGPTDLERAEAARRGILRDIRAASKPKGRCRTLKVWAVFVRGRPLKVFVQRKRAVGNFLLDLRPVEIRWWERGKEGK